MKHLPHIQHVFLLWAVAVSGLLLAMSGRLGSLDQENLQLRQALEDEQARVAYWMDYRSVDAEDGWAAYASCEQNYIELVDNDDACPNPNDVCGEALDICYSYCVEGRPTVQVEHAMCKAWWTGFIQRESSWRDLRKTHELP